MAKIGKNYESLSKVFDNYKLPCNRMISEVVGPYGFQYNITFLMDTSDMDELPHHSFVIEDRRTKCVARDVNVLDFVHQVRSAVFAHLMIIGYNSPLIIGDIILRDGSISFSLVGAN